MSWRPEEKNDGNTSLYDLIWSAISYQDDNGGKECVRLLKYIAEPIQILGVGDSILKLAKRLEDE